MMIAANATCVRAAATQASVNRLGSPLTSVPVPATRSVHAAEWSLDTTTTYQVWQSATGETGSLAEPHGSDRTPARRAGI